MFTNVISILSGLSVGGLIGAYAKAIFDKRQFRFTKAFEYKEARYKALTILIMPRLALSRRT